MIILFPVIILINYLSLIKNNPSKQCPNRSMKFYDSDLENTDDYIIRELWLGEDHSDRINCIKDKTHTSRMVRNDLTLMFKFFVMSMNNRFCNYSLITGTLLSAIRDNKLLQEWDYDMDIILLDDNCDIEFISPYRIERYRETGPSLRLQYGYPYKDLHIDIYKISENKSWVVNNVLMLNDHTTMMMIVENLNVRVLRDSSLFLSISYGNWLERVVYCGSNRFII